MLLSLSIRNFVIVDALTLDFAPGFSVLTGETGAGKSILIDALQLALGERADADVLREGASRAEISAEFRLHDAARAWIETSDLAGDSADTALLRRTVDASGRSKAFINGSAVTLAQLRELGELLVDVHGQHAHQSLLKPAAQLQLLDEHGGLADGARTVATRYRSWRDTQRALHDAEAMAGSAQREQQRLRWIVDELGEIGPVSGEWEAVQAEHSRLSHAASLLEGAQAAVDALAEADDAALTRIDTVSSRLEALAAYDPRLAPVLDALGAARIQVDDAARALTSYLARTEVDDRRLAEVDARVSALHAAGRKFKCAPEQLPALLDDARAQLAALDASADLDGLRQSEAEARRAYDTAAAALTRSRRDAADRMGREVTRAMQDLSLSGGRFEVALTLSEPSASGSDRIEFQVAGHAGVAPRPLARVASGGELARISLAISVIAATATPVSTLIFDEVDAGIGGAVAETVGRLLKQLGAETQVLAVTHLAQVAACADAHFVVSKTAVDGQTASRIEPVTGEARVAEVARMLGGGRLAGTSLAHAQAMLEGGAR